VGELHIPGFSDYLYPLGEDHLFAIGQDATIDGRVQGLALQIFDVSDATNPTLAHRYVYPDVGSSPANIDHRAIAFHPERDVVAFPYQRYDTGENTLEVFDISAQAGFTRLGGVGVANTLSLEYCLVNYYGYPAEDVQLLADQNGPEWEAQVLASCGSTQYFKRGLFRDDFVYGVGSNGVYAYDLGALASGAVGQADLPQAQYDYGSGVIGGDIAPIRTPEGVGGSAWAGTAGAGGRTSGGVAGAAGAAGAGGAAAAAGAAGAAGAGGADAGN
jgi:hypothetical protein